jgi:hypothetical protein
MLGVLWQMKDRYQEVILALLVIVAVWRGASPERWVAATFAAIWGVDRLYHLSIPTGLFWREVDLGHCAIDFVGFASIGWVALRANRIYPICLGALQLMVLMSHVVRGLSPAIVTGAYRILALAPSYLLIAVFAAGLLLHIRRQAKFGPYRSWQTY